uniref:Epidermal differentiation protein n=1 Tax=Meleagris gallopavo TaxID=9103 RepID=A0A803XVZ0_MELGA
MCSRADRGCHSSESSSCHSGGSSCHGSEEVTCHEVSAVQDVTPVVVLQPQGPVVTVPAQGPVAPVPCQQQQQQIKQPAQWPTQQQK